MSGQATYYENKTFSDLDYVEQAFSHREFYACHFERCDFSKSDLRSNRYEDCRFENCNFTMANISAVGFQDADFKACKLLGVDFSKCSKFMFSFRFEDCTLDYSIFNSTRLKKTPFFNCSLKETDFSATDLSGSSFAASDLTGTVFSGTNLEMVDFRDALNVAIDPEINRLNKARFRATQLEGLLGKYHLIVE